MSFRNDLSTNQAADDQNRQNNLVAQYAAIAADTEQGFESEFDAMSQAAAKEAQTRAIQQQNEAYRQLLIRKTAKQNSDNLLLVGLLFIAILTELGVDKKKTDNMNAHLITDNNTPEQRNIFLQNWLTIIEHRYQLALNYLASMQTSSALKHHAKHSERLKAIKSIYRTTYDSMYPHYLNITNEIAQLNVTHSLGQNYLATAVTKQAAIRKTPHKKSCSELFTVGVEELKKLAELVKSAEHMQKHFDAFASLHRQENTIAMENYIAKVRLDITTRETNNICDQLYKEGTQLLEELAGLEGSELANTARLNAFITGYQDQDVAAMQIIIQGAQRSIQAEEQEQLNSLLSANAFQQKQAEQATLAAMKIKIFAQANELSKGFQAAQEKAAAEYNALFSTGLRILAQLAPLEKSEKQGQRFLELDTIFKSNNNNNLRTTINKLRGTLQKKTQEASGALSSRAETLLKELTTLGQPKHDIQQHRSNFGNALHGKDIPAMCAAVNKLQQAVVNASKPKISLKFFKDARGVNICTTIATPEGHIPNPDAPPSPKAVRQ